MGIEDEVIGLVAEQAGLKNSEIKVGLRLAEDLNMDSLDEAEFAMKLEEKYKFSIPESDAEKLKTVGDVITYVRENAKYN